MRVRKPYLSLTWTDPDSGKRGYLVIDRLVDGLATGGTRLWAGVTLGEVEALARTMSLKSGLLRLPVGGCKLALDCAPTDPEAVPLLMQFLTAIRPLLETCVVAGPDLGTSRELIRAVYSEIGMVSPAQAMLDRHPNPESLLARLVEAESATVNGRCLADVVGGHGVAEAAEAGLGHVGIEIRDARAAIQGFGSMGRAVALCLARKGATIVAVADVEGTVANAAGLDIDAMLSTASSAGLIDRAALAPAVQLLPREAWITADAEVLVPAAAANAINERNCKQVRARLVVEAANLPTTMEAERRLHERGTVVVPDLIASSGTNAFYWWLLLGLIEPNAMAVLGRLRETIQRLVTEVLDGSRAHRVPPREIAVRLATANLEERDVHSASAAT